MRTDLRAWTLIATLLLAACGGSEEEAAAPAVDEDGNPIEATAPPAAGVPAANRPARQVLADVDTVILREIYSYSTGPRDPFESLVAAGTTGPELGDLQLVAIYYNEARPAETVAVLRERVSNRRHTLRPGQRVGRLYVAEIGQMDIWFTFDDFGVQRRESLTLRKQEDVFR